MTSRDLLEMSSARTLLHSLILEPTRQAWRDRHLASPFAPRILRSYFTKDAPFGPAGYLMAWLDFPQDRLFLLAHLLSS